jgi:hypothetical protein
MSARAFLLPFLVDLFFYAATFTLALGGMNKTVSSSSMLMYIKFEHSKNVKGPWCKRRKVFLVVVRM